MLFTVVGLLASLVLLIILLAIAKAKNLKRSLCLLAVLPLLIGLGASMVKTVPTGYTGILTTFGRVEEETKAAGVHLILPWQKIVRMDNRAQKVNVETEAFSSDIQQVSVQLAVNYCIDQGTAQNLYRTVGIDYYATVMYPRILEDTKATFSGYSAESLVAMRSELSQVIEDTLAADVSPYGITIISVSVEDVDFTDAFTDAVEAKQVAEQNKLRAQTEQDQLTMEAQQAAARQVIAANAEAEVAQIQADANLYAKQKQAEANEALASTLSEALIRYMQALAWDGKLPLYYGGSGDTMPILDLTE